MGPCSNCPKNNPLLYIATSRIVTPCTRMDMLPIQGLRAKILAFLEKHLWTRSNPMDIWSCRWDVPPQSDNVLNLWRGVMVSVCVRPVVQKVFPVLFNFDTTKRKQKNWRYYPRVLLLIASIWFIYCKTLFGQTYVASEHIDDGANANIWAMLGIFAGKYGCLLHSSLL